MTKKLNNYQLGPEGFPSTIEEELILTDINNIFVHGTDFCYIDKTNVNSIVIKRIFTVSRRLPNNISIILFSFFFQQTKTF